MIEKLEYYRTATKTDSDGCAMELIIYPNLNLKDITDKINEIIEYLNRTVDAEPVRHGHWEKVEETNGNYYHYECSKCGELPLNDNLVGEHTQLTPYCPWCGAKMDAKGEEQ